MLSFFAGFVADSQGFPSPVELFGIFPLLTVVPFYLCHDFLRKLHQVRDL